MGRVSDWLLLGTRVLVVVTAAKPIADKFFDYPGQVAFFAGLGLPQSELLVPLVGITELIAALLLLAGVLARIGALLLVPIMLTAMVSAGATAASVIVLVGALVILVFGPGRYAFWRFEEAVLYRWRH